MFKNILVVISVIIVNASCSDKSNTNNNASIIQDLESEKTKNRNLELITDSYHSLVISLNSDLSQLIEVETELMEIESGARYSTDYYRVFSDEVERKMRQLKIEIDQRSKQIDDLEIRMVQSNLEMSNREMRLTELRNLIRAREDRIIQLNSRIISLENNIDSLLTIQRENETLIMEKKLEIERITDQKAEISDKINQAYSIIKEEDYLLDRNIIIREKDFLKSSKFYLSKNLRTQFFTTIDIRKKLEFNIPSNKNIRIITGHPTSSFQLNSNGKNSTLTVIDPDEFWSYSNKLVISYKN